MRKKNQEIFKVFPIILRATQSRTNYFFAINKSLLLNWYYYIVQVIKIMCLNVYYLKPWLPDVVLVEFFGDCAFAGAAGLSETFMVA